MKWFYCRVMWLDDEIEDAIMGANEACALESAYKNWPDAFDIELIEGKTEEPTEKDLKKYIPKLFAL